jgi:hypothetical protein
MSMTRTDAGDRREFIIDIFMTRGKMRQAGAVVFRYDESGNPRKWRFLNAGNYRRGRMGKIPAGIFYFQLGRAGVLEVMRMRQP